VRFHALACDYDGTLAEEGRVDGPTLQALRRIRDSDRKLVLVTGRQVKDLLGVFPRADLFDRIVGENGAVVYSPSERSERLIAEPPAERLVSALRNRGVTPLSIGHVIVATSTANEGIVLDTIRELGVELELIFNQGALMLLPPGVTKATGLTVALLELGLTPSDAVGVGDAENDQSFLEACGCAVAVSNALSVVKQRADLVTSGAYGAGVVELIDLIMGTVPRSPLRSPFTIHRSRPPHA
jgi:HAD superfamily hydrolase (TIGR01484 family)